jgi:hypothetical protein
MRVFACTENPGCQNYRRPLDGSVLALRSGRPPEFEFIAPVRIVLQREDQLYRLGAAWARLAKRLERLANLADPRVRMEMVVSWRAIDPIEDRGDFQDFAPGFEKIPIKDLQGLA